MIVDDKLTREQHIDYISSKVTRNIGILKRIRRFISRESLLLLCHTLIGPYSKYCDIVWEQCSESLKDRLQTLQNRAARTIAIVPQLSKCLKFEAVWGVLTDKMI